RRVGKINFDDLKKMRIVLKRAKYFITCNGKTYDNFPLLPEAIAPRLADNSRINTPGGYMQLTLAQ
ncbi:MAG: hypothetical protein FWF80_01805, partial [Defluviitaleaceae bacterium]|nr:hypothetical protein [Defluviitaleaceae bacterium]